MHKLFWTFCTFLIILTLISSLGGGIRYRENFLEEIFDTIEDISENNNSYGISDSILQQTMVSSEENTPMYDIPPTNVPDIVTEEDTLKDPVVNTIPVVNKPTPTPTTNNNLVKTENKVNASSYDTSSYGPFIEAFDGEMYASF